MTESSHIAADAKVASTYARRIAANDALDAIIDTTIEESGSIDQTAYNAALDSINAAYKEAEAADAAYHDAIDEGNAAKAG